MKTSARNQFAGIVKRIRNGDVGSEVTITLPGGHELVAMITRESWIRIKEKLVFKSTAIIIATDLEHIKLSARNRLNGLICEVERGAVNSVITMDLGSGLMLTAGVTLQSTEQLNLHPGQHATAIFKAGSVVLGVLA